MGCIELWNAGWGFLALMLDDLKGFEVENWEKRRMKSIRSQKTVEI